ncbi:hypothetical protein WICPIJ_006290 [Wickerhamomyces pijperi]|uniref:Uncharacterized protein n=1 Tax=Wickerhamomyces pijperi TaxID=599730 RepID=A0A9P8Q408_WICPI|nr:hypothetical protein WICPIJ_006290 [Wickerhamomyces pijperi]
MLASSKSVGKMDPAIWMAKETPNSTPFIRCSKPRSETCEVLALALQRQLDELIGDGDSNEPNELLNARLGDGFVGEVLQDSRTVTGVGSQVLQQGSGGKKHQLWIGQGM